MFGLLLAAAVCTALTAVCLGIFCTRTAPAPAYQGPGHIFGVISVQRRIRVAHNRLSDTIIDTTIVNFDPMVPNNLESSE